MFPPPSAPVLNIPETFITCAMLLLICFIVPTTVLFSCLITSPTFIALGKFPANVNSTGISGMFTGSKT